MNTDENLNLPKQTTASEGAPQVKRYLGVRAYLQAVYEWRKKSAPDFSYSVWAMEFGFKSRSFLRLLLVGKRNITESSIPVLIKGLKLSKSDADYFEKLVRFSQAETIELKERYGRELSRSSQASVELSEIQNRLRFVSSPIIPRIQTLLSLEDTPRTLRSLAETLNVSIPETREALSTLEELRMITRHKNSKGEESWTPTLGQFEVKEELGNVALQSFYRKSLQESVQAIELPVETRNFQCALFPLNPEEYARFVEEMNEFLKQALTRYGTDEGRKRRLYQINLGLIPVSQPILHVEKSRSAPVGFVQPSNDRLENDRGTVS